jgi:hypothetical protein
MKQMTEAEVRALRKQLVNFVKPKLKQGAVRVASAVPWFSPRWTWVTPLMPSIPSRP